MSAISTALVIFGLMLIPAGIFAAISPKAVALHSRWTGLSIGLAFLLLFGIAMVLSPDGSEGKAEDVRASGVLAIVLWIAVTSFSTYMAKRSRARPERKAPFRKSAFWERIAAAYGRAVAQEQARLAEKKRLSETASLSSKTDFSIKATGRAQPYIDYDSGGPPHNRGKAAHFEYVDADGEVTDREVVNWVIDGRYLHGFCTLRRATRQFRLDRITDWKDWA